MEKDQNQDQKLLIIKRGQKILIEFLKRKIRTMPSGIRVLIKSHNANFIEYGFIINRIDAHCYHIVGEDSNREYFLNKDEFQEIEKNNFLYDIRDKKQ